MTQAMPIRNCARVACRVVSAFILAIPIASASASVSEPTAPKASEPPTEAPSYWAEGEPRAFVGARGIAGTGYGRVGGSAGYGLPNWQWIGVDSMATLTIDAVMAQAGLRGSFMIIDGMFTLRQTYSFSHRAIGTADRVIDGLIARDGVPGAEYLAIDAGLSGLLPYERLMGTWELSWVRPLSLRANELVLEEIQHVMIGPGGVWSLKLGLNVALTARKRAYLGAMGEYLHLVGRDEPSVYRLGPALWIGLTDHTEIGGVLTWPLHSPDQLGFLNGMYGAIGIQYQFATGEPRLAFP